MRKFQKLQFPLFFSIFTCILQGAKLITKGEALTFISPLKKNSVESQFQWSPKYFHACELRKGTIARTDLVLRSSDGDTDTTGADSGSTLQKTTSAKNKSEKEPTDSSPSGSADKVISRKDVEDDSNNELLESIVGAAFDATKWAFSELRWRSAEALTASLPTEKREEVLMRLSDRPNIESSGSNITATAQTDAVERGSVQEEISAALAKQAEINSQEKAEWVREKENIEVAKQMEQAANERVKSELAIQQQRLESEMAKVDELKVNISKEKAIAAADAEASTQHLQQQEAQLSKEKDEVDELSVQKELQNLEEIVSLTEKREKQQKQLKVVEDNLREEMKKEKALIAEVASTREKREQQQAELKIVEEDLRERIKSIDENKSKISQMKEEEQKIEISQVATEASTESTPDKESGYYSPKQYRNLSTEEKGAIKEKRAAKKPLARNEDKSDESSIHPVLGPVVSELGYKRIHLVSSGKLGTIPIWKKQRNYNHSRAKAMAADKKKSMHLGFPGIICLHEDVDGKLSVLDGQHRVGMMLNMLENKNAKEDSVDTTLFEKVLVEVYSQPQAQVGDVDSHAEKVFSEINKAEPIKLVDMPGVASAADRRVITEAVAGLKNQYPKMFSTSQRCRVPNVNVDNMRNHIFGANILNKTIGEGKEKEKMFDGGKKLNDWLQIQNAALGELYENSEERQSFVSERAWKKASENHFYLGLESSWLYNLNTLEQNRNNR